MKKLLLVALLIGIAGASLFAWEPNDLTKYPKFTKEGECIFNLGVGLGALPSYISDGYIYILPVRLTFDINAPLGDRKLPFFFGGYVGYSGQGYPNDWLSRIPLGFRFGYHFNWGVDKLDTYAVTTAGWVIHARTPPPSYIDPGEFFFGINVGARYYISKGFGFWAEAGYNALSFLDVGISFKF